MCDARRRREVRHELDLLVACKTCGSAVGVDCLNLKPIRTVHFERRVLRLLKERGVTEEYLQKAIDTSTTIKGN